MPTNSYVTTISTSLKMIETSLWKIATEVSCSVVKDTLTEGESIVVSGFVKPALSGKTITLAYRRPEGSVLNRTVITGSDGSYSDSYTPDAAGSWSVTASWEGDSTHEGATGPSKSFTVTVKLL
ncbi:MAG: Ig-like domain-containing protein [Candidatus Bathyarchaeia archaeon]